MEWKRANLFSVINSINNAVLMLDSWSVSRPTDAAESAVFDSAARLVHEIIPKII